MSGWVPWYEATLCKVPLALLFIHLQEDNCFNVAGVTLTTARCDKLEDHAHPLLEDFMLNDPQVGDAVKNDELVHDPSSLVSVADRPCEG